MMPRLDELKAGSINHVVGLGIPHTGAKIGWPCGRGDGGNPNGIPYCQRFRIKPGVNIDALRLTPAARIIAKAVQKYGGMVTESSGAVGFASDNAAPYRARGENPYATLTKGRKAWDPMEGFPWEHVEFLPLNYGKPA